MINAVIIDDENGARELVANMLKMLAPEINITGEADGVQTGIKLINEKHPNLVFLDIQMQDGTGFDLLQKLGDSSVKVIFITAFQDFAVEAFNFSAIDYLLKPVSPERLLEAVDKVKKSLDSENETLKIKALLNNIQSKDKKVVLKTSDSVFVVDVHEIVRCESEGNYTTFILEDGRKLLVSKIIKYYDDLLFPYNFFRTHQSHLINFDYFKEYLKKDEQILMKNGDLVPIASRKKEAFMAHLAQF